MRLALAQNREPVVRAWTGRRKARGLKTIGTFNTHATPTVRQ